jgi:hypothetical protein
VNARIHRNRSGRTNDYPVGWRTTAKRFSSTLELSGGGAVRLNDWLDGRPPRRREPERYRCFECSAMPRSLWPASEERTAWDTRHVATNRARQEVQKGEVLTRAQIAMNVQRTKHHNAGQPSTTQRGEPEKIRNVSHTSQLQKVAALTSNVAVEKPIRSLSFAMAARKRQYRRGDDGAIPAL